MLFPMAGIVLSVLLLFLMPYNGFLLFFHIVSLLCAGLLLCFEPIFYIINKDEIRVICVFKQYCFSYREIQQIILKFDVFFEFLFVKDYVLILDMRTRIPERCKRILKCTNTKKLINEYYNEKVKL